MIYAGDPNHAGWYIGFDWTSRPRGTIKLGQPVNPDQTLVQAPDGSGFLVLPFKGLGGRLLDRLGRAIASLPAGMDDVIWAGDAKHYCSLDGSSSGWQLRLTSLDGSSTTHFVALDSSLAEGGIVAFQLSACSVTNDRAVITYSAYGRPTAVWLVRISDGAILRHETFPANELAGITASADASLLAYNSNQSTGYLLGGSASETAVRRASSGVALATLSPSYGVIAFSSDDAAALVNTSPWAAGVPTRVAVVELRTAIAIWGSQGTPDEQSELALVLAEPGGGDFALFMKDPSTTSAHPAVRIVIVTAGGQMLYPSGTFSLP